MTPYPTLMITHLHYHRWASHELMQAVRQLDDENLMQDRNTSFKTIPQTMLHIYHADQVWFWRLSGSTSTFADLSKDADLPALTVRWNDLLDTYVTWAEALKPEDWESAIQYKNSQGNEYANPVWQIVLHLVNHGTAHRAQVVSMLRQSGVAPPTLDLINYYRTVDAPR